MNISWRDLGRKTTSVSDTRSLSNPGDKHRRMGSQNGRAVLNPVTRDALRADAASGKFTVVRLATKYGISERQVVRVINGENWPT
jgi:hypothetical protein